MEIIMGNRNSGKTTKLIEEAHKYNGYIVAIDRQDADRIYKQAMMMDKDINYPLTYAEFIGNRYYDRGVRHIYIDNAEMLLQRMTNVPITAITINNPQ